MGTGMTGPLVVVSGTGTSIGKTHFAEALLRAWGRGGARVAGLKPIESGVADPEDCDAARLRAASTFHVKPFGYAFRDGVSPHLAARRAGTRIAVEPLCAAVERVRQDADGVLVELPGGLFSPLDDAFCNVDLALALKPDLLLLVAPDRLGVLHDVAASARAAAASGLRVDGLVVMAPPIQDASTGTNAAELSVASRIPVLASLPRAAPAELSRSPALSRCLRALALLSAGHELTD
jgi:dethiobiotin synthetase